ncbi:hypothetical protein OEG84_11600 [Hoeflea sp. G2-23]|uniref:Uncharacterized protein n=1 Tax=Hoeflea algicola TaxID=2983763 RepID=A0ABT3Z9J7_9HYPH|nr:hypothetical protein [Hoeflea algicola]MCY0148338.1 hypothetical protein [Hoeflea algicola]
MKHAHITDHALVRWLERAKGLDMEAYRTELKALAQPMASVCSTGAWIDGNWFVMKKGSLITVLDDKPGITSAIVNDRGERPPKPVPIPWQALKRKRSSK